MSIKHCQGFVPREVLENYWELTEKEKADAFDYLMRSTSSNIRKYPENKDFEFDSGKMEYAVFTESGEQWDNYLTLNEAKQCLLEEEEIGEGKLTYKKMENIKD